MSGDRVPASPYCLYDIPSNDVNAETSLSPFSFVEVVSPLKFVTPMVSCGGSRLICECQRSCAGGKTCSNSPDFLLSLPTTPLNSQFRYRGVFSCNSFLGFLLPPSCSDPISGVGAWVAFSVASCSSLCWTVAGASWDLLWPFCEGRWHRKRSQGGSCLATCYLSTPVLGAGCRPGMRRTTTALGS